MSQKKQYHKSGKQIISEKKMQKRMGELITKLNEDESLALPNLTGRDVVLNVLEYEKRIENKEMSGKFLEWFNENKETTFTVKGRHEPYMDIYDLEGVEGFMFSYYDFLDPSKGLNFLE